MVCASFSSHRSRYAQAVRLCLLAAALQALGCHAGSRRFWSTALCDGAGGADCGEGPPADGGELGDVGVAADADTADRDAGDAGEQGACLEIIEGDAVYGEIDLRCAVEIHGDLTIAATELTSLAELSHLEVVSGTLRIVSNPLLETLAGLEQLESVENIWIEDCPELATLAGLDGVTFVVQQITLIDLAGLTALAGLGGADFIAGLRVIRLPLLVELLDQSARVIELDVQDCDALQGIAAPGVEIKVDAAKLVGNDGLTSLTGLVPWLGELELLWVIDNAALASISALGTATAVHGDVVIRGNPSLANLAGLGAVTEIEGDVEIARNENLGTLEGLDALASVGGDLTVADNPALGSLAALAALSSVAGDLTLARLQLGGLQGLSALVSVSGTLRLNQPGAIANLNPLSALTTLGGLDASGLQISGLEGLGAFAGTQLARMSIASTGVSALPSWLSTITQVTGDFTLYDNDQLAGTLSPLTSLTQVGGRLTVLDNAVLSNISGLMSVVQVGALALGDNGGGTPPLIPFELETTMIRDLELRNVPTAFGLESIVQVTGRMFIEVSSVTTSLGGLGNIARVDGDVIVQGEATSMILKGLFNLQTVGGSLLASVVGADDLQLFTHLASVGATFSISGWPDLPTLEGMLDVTSVKHLRIVDNAALGSLAGLSGITRVETLELEGNCVLTDLLGAHGMIVTESLTLTGSPLLDAAEIEAFVASTGFSGTPRIDAGAGCP